MQNDPQLFSIGEFSQISGLSVKALRFYDEKGLLKPARVDPATDYRYYDAACAERARVIGRLRELQFSLDDIAGILAECGDEADLLAALRRQQRAIAERMRADRKVVGMLEKTIGQETRAAELVRGGPFKVEDKQLERTLLAGVRMKGRYDECGRGFGTVARAMGRHLGGMPFCLNYDAEYREEGANFETCIPLKREAPARGDVFVRVIPATRCVALLHQGPYRKSVAAIRSCWRRRSGVDLAFNSPRGKCISRDQA